MLICYIMLVAVLLGVEECVTQRLSCPDRGLLMGSALFTFCYLQCFYSQLGSQNVSTKVISVHLKHGLRATSV